MKKKKIEQKAWTDLGKDVQIVKGMTGGNLTAQLAIVKQMSRQ